MSFINSNQLQTAKKTVTFKRNTRSISSTQFNYPKLLVTKDEYSQYINASNVDTNQQQKDQYNDLNQSRLSSSHSKYYIEDQTEKVSKQQDIKTMQKQMTEVQNLQEWINLKKFGQRDNYEEQIENILNQNELKQRPDIRVDMIDDIMNSQNNHKHKDQNIQLSIKAKKKNEITSSVLADKTFYKSSDYAKSYITNKNLLNQILQKKMKDYSEQEEKTVMQNMQKETSQDDFKKTNFQLSQSSQRFFKQFVDNQTHQAFKNNDSRSQIYNQTVTLKKLLTYDQEPTQDQTQKINTSYSMNQLQKITNSKAGELINKFSGFQNFKRDICKSIIDYQAIKQSIIASGDTNKDQIKLRNGNSRRPSSLNSQKLITLYQPDYPLEKYQKKKNSTQEEKDPFLKKQEQEKEQQYEALQEISKIKKSEYHQIKKQYQQTKERIQQLGLQQIQTVQQIKQIKQTIQEQSSKLEENLKQLSLNKRQNNKSSRGVRYSNTDHDRSRINQVIEEEDEEEQQQNMQQESNLITFSQFNQDCPPSPLKHKKFSKKQKDKKSSQFETIEEIIEQSKLELKGLEKKQQELNITIERLKEEQQHKQKEKKDTLFELKKLYQIFMKNQENWRYEKIFWVQSEMHELGQPITEEYFPTALEPQSQEFLKQVFLLQKEDKKLDQKWQQWKNEYQVDPTVNSKLQEKSFFNLLEKMKRNIKLVRQSNIDITVKKRSDRLQCKETLNKLLNQASDLMNQDASIGSKEKIISEFIEQEEQYIEQKQEIKLKIDYLTKQEVNRLFNKYPISNESSLNEIKNVFYMILNEFQAKRFSKKYQLLRESSAISEQKKNKHIDYDELREKIKSSLNKSAQLKVVTSSQRKKRAISTNINNLSTQTDQDTLQTSKQLSKFSQNTSTNLQILNFNKLENTSNLPLINFYDFYGMKTPHGNYVVV
ncbi:kinase domain protein (macronuclear) [Tetrahymena thermophila SB210]|uniref:Kinase domain protein n=1 Tax=Tetrahymena thermophila (strain SB210) TaxID=312017 RepID=W7XGJ6_TETTS|nr:kinase domain protein [Tetrahymena thermophila SB210]EWS72039.1 kinase domain protein [Tetrahymena thermophila SB210]|eukprot:XP_012655414.1 kinase domain protein [Tetrahymena thermophila SB210]